ncbi:MAG: type II toxin-antitoxin system VapC family toxin [Fimbriimonadaceae bacterium]|nr:type II toxin-antitoxin system VapC family toxin [Fimbriimonadaceae bacterium]
MKLLLDTSTFLWCCEDSPKLSAAALEQLRDPANRLFLSAVSAHEIGLKVSIGKLSLRLTPEAYITQMRELHRIGSLPLTETAAVRAAGLPSHHRDPFDRMLVAQALAHDCALVTSDRAIRSYPVTTIW